jgi:hypothetical protein
MHETLNPIVALFFPEKLAVAQNNGQLSICVCVLGGSSLAMAIIFFHIWYGHISIEHLEL